MGKAGWIAVAVIAALVAVIGVLLFASMLGPAGAPEGGATADVGTPDPPRERPRIPGNATGPEAENTPTQSAEPTPVAGVVHFEDGRIARAVEIEGCGDRVTTDAQGRFSLDALDLPCDLRAVVRNGGAESRGPRVRIEFAEDALALEVPEVPPWEPPVPPAWADGGADGLTPQQRRDQRLAYLLEVMGDGSLTPEQEAITHKLVEQLEQTHFE